MGAVRAGDRAAARTPPTCLHVPSRRALGPAPRRWVSRRAWRLWACGSSFCQWWAASSWWAQSSWAGTSRRTPSSRSCSCYRWAAGVVGVSLNPGLLLLLLGCSQCVPVLPPAPTRRGRASPLVLRARCPCAAVRHPDRQPDPKHGVHVPEPREGDRCAVPHAAAAAAALTLGGPMGEREVPWSAAGRVTVTRPAACALPRGCHFLGVHHRNAGHPRLVGGCLPSGWLACSSLFAASLTTPV